MQMTDATTNDTDYETVEDETVTEEQDESDQETVDIEEYQKLKERLAKAEKRIIEQKKTGKASKQHHGDDVITKKDLEVMRFIDKNPDFDGLEDQLKSYLDKGLSLQEASIILKNTDTVLVNRDKTKSMSITGGQAGGSKTTYTKEEFAKLPQSKINELYDKVKSGQIKVI